MRPDLNTCSSQSAMHHGVPVRAFFRRSSEHHSRNDSSSTTWSHDSHVFSHSRTLVVPGTFLRVLYNNIHHHVAFARELEEKKNTEQDQPAVRSAVAAAAAAAAAAAEAAAAEASSSNSNSTSSSSRKAEAAEDAESTSQHPRMYSVYSSTRFFGLIFEDEKTVAGT